MAEGKLDQETIDRWRANPCQFIEEALAGPEIGTAYRLLPAERAFVAHAFKTGADGRLLYPEQCYSSGKKGGKTTLAGLHLLATTILYGGRFAEGICCANDLEQSTGRI